MLFGGFILLIVMIEVCFGVIGLSVVLILVFMVVSSVVVLGWLFCSMSILIMVVMLNQGKFLWPF